MNLFLCSLLPLRHKLLVYAVLLSEWVRVTIESEPSTNSADLDPMFPDLWNFPQRWSFLQSILQRCCLVTSSEPVCLNTVFYVITVKAQLKPHAVMDCLFFFLEFAVITLRRYFWKSEQHKQYNMNLWIWSSWCHYY